VLALQGTAGLAAACEACGNQAFVVSLSPVGDESCCLPSFCHAMHCRSRQGWQRRVKRGLNSLARKPEYQVLHRVCSALRHCLLPLPCLMAYTAGRSRAGSGV
jgi:hypothetical protein